MAKYPFVRARNYTRVGGRDIDLIVVHTAEYPERPTGAEWVADYFAGRNAPRASAHYAIDNDSVVQGVRDQDVAWAAPGANHNGLQFEHAGYAAQGTADWHDPYSQAMLRRSAMLAAEKVVQYNIPLRWLGVNGLEAGGRGFVTHDTVSKTFRLSDHWDPGKSFPHGEYLRLVKDYRLALVAEPEPKPHWKWRWARWRLGEGEYREFGPMKGPRPGDAPARIPPQVWAWYALFVSRRRKK